MAGISEVVDLERLQNISAEFADATSLGIITVDCRGVPVTPPCGFTEFCLAIREDPIRRQLCYSCDAHGGLQAVIDGKPRIYRCHAGLVDFSIPIVTENHYLGAVLCGQVRVNDNCDELGYIIGSQLSWRADESMLDKYDKVASTTMRKVNSAASMLLSLSQEMVKRGTSSWTMPLSEVNTSVDQGTIATFNDHKVSATQAIETPQPGESEVRDSLAALRACIENEDMPGASGVVSHYLDTVAYGSGHYLDQECLNALEDEIIRLAHRACPAGAPSVKQAVQRQRTRRSPQINRYKCQLYVESLLGIMQDSMMKTNPAWKHSLFGLLNYLERNPSRAWTLKDAANFLGVSLSHASRQFKAYTGKNFVAYVTKKRIDRAKLMLTRTDMPVLKIAKELDFQSNYFSRLFKLSTGLSPSEFRQVATAH